MRFSRSEDSDLSEINYNTYYPLGIGGNAQLGYSRKRWIFGASYEFQSTSYNEDRGTHITNYFSYAKIFVGYRLDAPGFVSSIFEKINNTLWL